jgi:hypothetical protein
MKTMYWIGTAFGVGMTVFVAGVLVEAGVFSLTPESRPMLLKYVGALVAFCAAIAAREYNQRHRS